MPTTHSYTTRLVEILRKMAETQDAVLDQAATAAADALDRGNLIHLFGSGHSVIPTLDAFPRYGSFVGLNPLTDPRLMWHNVLGPGGVRELLWLERTENYVDKFLSHQPLTAGDVLVCFSHGGTNAAAIEAAMFGRTLPVFVSPTVPGATLASNDEVFDQHRRYLHEAQGRTLR